MFLKSLLNNFYRNKVFQAWTSCENSKKGKSESRGDIMTDYVIKCVDISEQLLKGP